MTQLPDRPKIHHITHADNLRRTSRTAVEVRPDWNF
jgi:hypothetical protein